MIKKRLLFDIFFIAGFIYAASINIINTFTSITGMTSFAYFCLTLCWVGSLRWEIRDPYIRHRLEIGGFLVASLFVFRQLRWDVFNQNDFADRLCWYCYYIPTVITPILSLEVALHIGKSDTADNRRISIPLWIYGALSLLIALTNDFHGFLYKIWYTDGQEHSSAGFAFYIILICYILSMIITFLIMMVKCRISSLRRHCYIPIASAVINTTLWSAYYLNGGSSPSINGIRLYNIQEVQFLIFAGFWESCILIGLLPSYSLIHEREWISDGIRESVERELCELKDEYKELINESNSAFKKSLVNICCLGVYTKRRANLELLTDERGYLKTSELSLAIRETFDYYKLKGITSGLEETGEADVPALFLILAFELYHNTIKSSTNACYVKVQTLQSDEALEFRLITECDASGASKNSELSDYISKRKKLFDLLEAKVSFEEEDDTTTVKFCAKYPLASRRGLFNIKLAMKSPGTASIGLRGLISYLSIENEALDMKTKIHDSLGRCLLMSRRYLTNAPDVSREVLLSEWKNALDIVNLGRSSKHITKADKSIQNTSIEYARSMGVNVKLQGTLPEDEHLSNVIDTAIIVNITNIKKHTVGDTSYIRCEDKNGNYILTFEDNGGIANKEVAENGGLKNLRDKVNAAGGTMKVTCTDRYRVVITLPKTELTELKKQGVTA